MFEPYNMYNQYGMYNPYPNYNQQLQQRQNQPTYKPQTTVLQGKVVDSLDVVKAADIPYDGSVSYVPLTDNSAIITKQLQQDGTSKVIIYKPISNELEENKPKYVTESDLEKQLKDVNSKDIKDIKEDIKTLKRKLEDITDDIKYKKEK